VSISPPSDIVLDVARAADPQKYRAAADKLASVGAGQAAPVSDPAAGPASQVPRAGPPVAATSPAPRATGAQDAARLPAASAASQTAERQRAQKAYGQFEAYFLQTFIEAMLPKDAESLFGKGPAGAIWKSMMAEQLAGKLAESHSFGIAEAVAEKRKRIEDAKGAPPPAAVFRTSADTAREDAFAAALRKLLAIEGEQAAAAAAGTSAQSPAGNGPLV
jgi:Rod binding domain-containing protein